MKIISQKESIELCTESGWHAYDLATDVPIQKETIERLGQLGTLTYLAMLSQPFYRVEQEYFMIKGLEGNNSLRVAMLGGEEAILDKVYSILEVSVG